MVKIQYDRQVLVTSSKILKTGLTKINLFKLQNIDSASFAFEIINLFNSICFGSFFFFLSLMFLVLFSVYIKWYEWESLHLALAVEFQAKNLVYLFSRWEKTAITGGKSSHLYWNVILSPLTTNRASVTGWD